MVARRHGQDGALATLEMLYSMLYTDVLGGVNPLTSDNTPSSDPKPDPL